MRRHELSVNHDAFEAVGFDEERYLNLWKAEASDYQREDVLRTFNPKNYYGLPDEERRTLDKWIGTHISEGRKGAWLISSNTLRNLMQQDTGLYVSHPCMRGALLHAGWVPKTLYSLTWWYQRMAVSVNCPKKPDGEATCRPTVLCPLCINVRPYLGRKSF